MNIEGLQTIWMNNLPAETGVEKDLTAYLNLPKELTLQTGQIISLKIMDTGQILLTTPTEENITIPKTSLVLNKTLPTGSFTEIEAKVGQPQNSGQIIQNNGQPLQILTIDGKSPQVYFNQTQTDLKQPQNIEARPTEPALVKDISGFQKIPIQNLTLSEIATPIVDKLPLSPLQKNELQSALQQVEIKFRPSNTEGTKETLPQKILETVSTVLEKESVQLEKMSPQIPIETQKIVQELGNELKQFIGEKIPVEIMKDTNIIKTGLGEIEVQTKVPLPENLFADLEIVDIVTQSSPLVQKTPLDKIQNLLQTLKTENPKVYAEIEAKLPAANENMLPNMVSFIKAALKGDVKQWLGAETVSQIENQGQAGQVVLTELQNALQESSKQTPMWKIIEIPYYAENHMQQIKLAVKQYPEEDETENQRQKFGTRFVVDTNFTALGAFQFDGFSFAQDRRFDLIVRTEHGIGNDLCANIMRIFKKTLNDVQYTGNIKINLKENFIKISENSNDDNFLAQGLFI